MSTIETTAELEEAVRFATTGKADPAILKHIVGRSDEIQEQLHKKYGDRELSLELLREIREEELGTPRDRRRRSGRDSDAQQRRRGE